MRGVLFVCALAACGGTSKAPAAPAEDSSAREEMPADDEEDQDGGDALEVTGTRGHMDPEAVKAGLAEHAGELEGCFTSQVGKRRFLAGKVELKWQVAADGAITSVQLAQSDLGAWPVEKCLLDIARGMSFTKPKGGATDFSIPLEFSGKQSSTWWDEEAGQAAVKNHLKDLAKCEKSLTPPSDAVVTAYVGTRGKVVSVGFATAQEAGLDAATWDAWADCAEKRITSWQLPDPRGSIAKLAFHYPAP
jgi:hypothetical protein